MPADDQIDSDFNDSTGTLDRALVAAFGDDSLEESGGRSPEPVQDLPVPKRIGRYQIERLVGAGAYGQVYLGHDETLHRPVAIKVPHKRYLSEDVSDYLAEARALAALDNPNIVPIFDVGSEDRFPCFIVSKFVDGESLAHQMRERRFTRAESAQLVATVADALHHAHKCRLVHRDIKPGNLLLDRAGKIYVADFGVALRSFGSKDKNRIVGTPAYMSPEQARGEGHRVDGRSDIFSLGVVLYELISGRRPFRAERKRDLLRVIVEAEAPPPRQLDESIPRELERICLKAMSRFVRDRYTTAHDFADELRQFLAEHDSSTRPTQVLLSDLSTHPATESTPNDRPSSAPPPKVFPKGLRSYDHHDSRFFLELLPGPCDRNGLPESIRFWKQQVESVDAGTTFSVGLIYGPSGCGKSSMVKAGLIPQLSASVLPIYVEATQDGTESQLLTALRKQCVWLPVELDLTESFSLIRERQTRQKPGQGPQKVVVFIDQFEQWLHSVGLGHKDRLLNALRQCDGGAIQCVLMVRDDFWMSITRFFRQLEITMVEGHNTAGVDLFTTSHAKLVLAHFGRALGALPEKPRDMTSQHHDFLGQAVASLAEQESVVSVRLAMFAQMMKDRQWNPKTLQRLGGAGGVGVAFLDDAFGSNAAPLRRYHALAARKVLEALLPVPGVDIKGRMLSHNALLTASGYQQRPVDFDELIQLLDSELRLITPFDSARQSPDESQPDGSTESGAAYHLTHDYLVPSIRKWLTRQRLESRRGRAELLLRERSTAWNVQPSNRNLPSFVEYASIRAFVRAGDVTEAQQKMIRRADGYFGLRGVVTFLTSAILLLLALTINNRIEQRQEAIRTENDIENARTLVDSLLTSPAEAVPFALASTEPVKEHATVELSRVFADEGESFDRRLKAALGLAHYGDFQTEFLAEAVAKVDGLQRRNLVKALGDDASADDKLVEMFGKSKNVEHRVRLAVLLLNRGRLNEARSMLHRLSPDPTDHFEFVASLLDWIAEPSQFVQLLAVEDAIVRVGICNALAEFPVTRLSDTLREELKPRLIELACQDPHPGVHSAAGLVLRRWNIDLPEIEEGTESAREQRTSRLLSELAKTIDDIQSYRREAAVANRGQLDRPIEVDRRLTVSLSRFSQIQNNLSESQNGWFVDPTGLTMIIIDDHHSAFAVCDRQISVGLFQAFARDTKFDWPGHNQMQSPTLEHPVQDVSWLDAVKFCNWLSTQAGFTPCYKDGRLVSGNGYRMPTEGESFRFRSAAAETVYFCGNDSRHLGQYATYNQDTTSPGASKLPNRWGIFDTFGNVHELAASHEGVSYYSGCFVQTANGLRINEKETIAPSQRDRTVGFRVARNYQAAPSATFGLFTTDLTDNGDSLNVARDRLTFLDDYAEKVNWARQLPAKVREISAPDLPTYAAIDRELAAPSRLRIDPDAAMEYRRERMQGFLDWAADSKEEKVNQRLGYAKARLLQLSGECEKAADTFDSLTNVDLHRPEPMIRLIECLAATNNPSVLTKAREGIRRWVDSPDLWNLWMIVSLDSMTSRQLLDEIESLRRDVRALGHVQDVEFIVRGLESKGNGIRINCGASESATFDGEFWSRDRFFDGGRVGSLPGSISSPGASYESEIRSFDRRHGGGYRIPLPNGEYQVTLYFTEGWYHDLGIRIQDVAIQGDVVLKNQDLVEPGFGVTDRKQFATRVDAGVLCVDFLPQHDLPYVNAIEIVPLSEAKDTK